MLIDVYVCSITAANSFKCGTLKIGNENVFFKYFTLFILFYFPRSRFINPQLVLYTIVYKFSIKNKANLIYIFGYNIINTFLVRTNHKLKSVNSISILDTTTVHFSRSGYAEGNGNVL